MLLDMKKVALLAVVAVLAFGAKAELTWQNQVLTGDEVAKDQDGNVLAKLNMYVMWGSLDNYASQDAFLSALNNELTTNIYSDDDFCARASASRVRSSGRRTGRLVCSGDATRPTRRRTCRTSSVSRHAQSMRTATSIASSRPRSRTASGMASRRRSPSRRSRATRRSSTCRRARVR